MKRELLGIAALGAALGILLAVTTIISDISSGTACNSAIDCDGIAHDDCDGGWACRTGECSWECAESLPFCERPSDCDSLPHIMCLGAWACESGKCVWGCEINEEEPVVLGETPSIDGIIFIEQRNATRGQLIAGGSEYTFLGESTYTFNSEERTLTGKAEFSLEGLRAIYASGKSLSGDAGSGSSTKLYPVKAVPTGDGGDRITAITSDGTVTIEHAGKTITLAPGESWSETTIIESAGKYALGITRLTSTDTIVNWGFLDKGDIVLS